MDYWGLGTQRHSSSRQSHSLGGLRHFLESFFAPGARTSCIIQLLIQLITWTCTRCVQSRFGDHWSRITIMLRHIQTHHKSTIESSLHTYYLLLTRLPTALFPVKPHLLLCIYTSSFAVDVCKFLPLQWVFLSTWFVTFCLRPSF